MKRTLIGLSLAVVLLLAVRAPLATAAGPWHAQIVDAETKQPLEGVVVVGLWTKHVRGPGGASSEYYDSKEVMTDRDGRFTIAARSFFSLNPFVFFRGPEFVFFKPGYGQEVWPGWYTEATQWSPEKRKRLGRYSELLQLDGMVLEMPRWRTLGERKEYIGKFTIPAELSFNRQQIPLLEKATVDERRAMGYGN